MASVASCVRAMSIETSTVSASSRLSNFSCTFTCLIPIINCSTSLSSISVASQKWHFFACVLHLVMNSSAVSVAVCLYFCRLKRLSLKFDLGYTCILNFDHITSTFFLFSLDKSYITSTFFLFSLDMSHITSTFFLFSLDMSHIMSTFFLFSLDKCHITSTFILFLLDKSYIMSTFIQFLLDKSHIMSVFFLFSRFNKICHPSQRPRWQVDTEAFGLSRVQQFSSVCNPPS